MLRLVEQALNYTVIATDGSKGVREHAGIPAGRGPTLVGRRRADGRPPAAAGLAPHGRDREGGRAPCASTWPLPGR